jgi:hypothetical protein
MEKSPPPKLKSQFINNTQHNIFIAKTESIKNFKNEIIKNLTTASSKPQIKLIKTFSFLASVV